MNGYLDFKRVAPLPPKKTCTVYVHSRRHGDLLGVIKWYGAWRQYAFFPEAGTVWNPDCLDAVNGCIRGLMAERRKTVPA